MILADDVVRGSGCCYDGSGSACLYFGQNDGLICGCPSVDGGGFWWQH